MTDDLKKRLAESSEKLVKWVENTTIATEDFVAEQAPLVVNEIIQWQIWGNVATIVLLSIFFVLTWGLTIKLWKTTEDWPSSNSDEGPRVFVRVVSGIGAGSSTIFLVLVSPVAVFGLVKALVAPRLVILETLSTLI